MVFEFIDCGSSSVGLKPDTRSHAQAPLVPLNPVWRKAVLSQVSVGVILGYDPSL